MTEAKQVPSAETTEKGPRLIKRSYNTRQKRDAVGTWAAQLVKKRVPFPFA
jgi:hypothetical protein